jgi:hypothetical protein
MGKPETMSADASDISFDPRSSTCLGLWKELADSSPCPYAMSANVWGSPCWDSQRTIVENAETIVPYLVKYIGQEANGSEAVDGFVVQPLPSAFPAETTAELAGSFREFLAALNNNDPSRSDCMAREIDSKDWEFYFNGKPLFISVFSPLYPADHVRHAEHTFIFFQLQYTFDRYGVGDNIRQTPRVLRILSDIEARFGQKGYQYPSESVDNVPKAHKYLLPRWSGDETVQWWKTD